MNYNCAGDTIECIQSLSQSTYAHFSIVVVDNRSTDDSLLHLHAFFSEEYPSYQTISSGQKLELMPIDAYLTLIESEQNLGFAAGNNLALSKLLNEDRLIWLLNPDVVVDKNCLQQMVSDYKKNRFAVLGSSIYDYSNQTRLLNYGAAKINWFSGTVRHIKSKAELPHLDYIYGASFFTTSSIFRTYGLLLEKYFLYWEETDFCLLLTSHGEKLGISFESKIYDKVGGSIGRGYLAFFYYSRNALYVIRKYKPEKIKFVLVLNMIRVIKRFFCLDFQIGKAIFNGTIDFLRNPNR